MFSKLVKRNSRRDRKNSGLYFGSMIISIIAFYIILSLSHQDVMIFLKEMESDAVRRLLGMIPTFYVATLVILFFLVYYASSMMMDRRKHEFGVYLTLGMTRSKLFFMLMLEDLWNNVIALCIGLPVAVAMSELISLVTAKVVGLGIIGHRFSLSMTAILLTLGGFMAVKTIAYVFLSTKVIRKEIGELLHDSSAGLKKQWHPIVYLSSMLVGIFMLGKAYHYGITGLVWVTVPNMGLTVFLGGLGTVLLFFGIRLFIGIIAGLNSGKPLHTYNFRQVQELVIHQSTIIALCSLLIFSALCLFGAGVSISADRTNTRVHVLDYTFKNRNHRDGERLDIDQVKSNLERAGMASVFSTILEVRVGYPSEHSTVRFDAIIENLQALEASRARDVLIHNMKQYQDCYLLSLSGYNDLRKAANLEPILLANDEVRLYLGQHFLVDETTINAALKNNPKVEIMGEMLRISGDVESLAIVTDSEITLSTVLIVSDETFGRYTNNRHDKYVSAVLQPGIVKEKGLLTAIMETNQKLNATGLAYESYLQNIGRQLFYVISASYITIYLAVVLLVVANTIIGVQFLMGQSKSYKRYQTLIHLGATYETLCKSASKQINWYFGLPVGIAVVNSLFGVYSLFTGILPSSIRDNIPRMLTLAIGSILLLGVFETVYIIVVKKNSYDYLRTQMQPKRVDS